jgi:phosphate/sulfate permease
VAETVRGQIANPAAFANKPDVFAFGMMVSLLSAGIWLVSKRRLGWVQGNSPSLA